MTRKNDSPALVSGPRKYRAWREADTVDVAQKRKRAACILAPTLREAGAIFAARLGAGTHVVMVAPAPLSFPAAVHALTCEVAS